MTYVISAPGNEATEFTAAKALTDVRPVYVFAPQGYLTTTLTASINATATSIVGSSFASFPTTGWVVIDGEYIYYSSRNGTTLTVPETQGRASLSTVRAAHANGSTVRVAYAFSSAPIAGRESNSDVKQYLAPPDGLAQKVRIEDGTSELGTANFVLSDQAEWITSLIASNSFAFRDRYARVLMGFQTITEDKYKVIGTMRTREIKLDSTLTRYRWSCIDLQRALRDRIQFGETTLPAAITSGSPANGGTLTVTATTNFASAGYVRVDDEIIQYTAKTATTFTGITRAALSTTADDHSADAGASEVYSVQGNPIDLLLKFMLTSAGDGTNSFYDSLDTTKGLGIDYGLIDIAGFESQRDAFFNGYQFLFYLQRDDMEDFKKWAEQEINRCIPGRFVIKANGQLSYRVAAPLIQSTTPVEVDEDNLIGFPEWDLGGQNVINDITIKYDHDILQDKFLVARYQLNASSQSKHGEGRKLTIESKGLRSSLSATTIADKVFDYYDHRFAEPAPEARCDIRTSDIGMEVANGALFSHKQIPNLTTGRRGVTGKQMEIAEASIDYNRGTTKVLLRDLNQTAKYGAIAPNTDLDDGVSAFPDYNAASAAEKRYAYIAVTGTEEMSNGDPATVII